MSISEKEILDVLEKIETGKLNLEKVDNQGDIYSGNIVFDISNGWEITIFKDANNWDYIDNIKTHKGESIDFEILEGLTEIKNYYPPKEVCLNIYKMGFEED